MAFQLTKLKNERKKKQAQHLNNRLKQLSVDSRQRGLLQAILQILSFLNPPRLREVWAHPHSFARFDMVEARFTDDQYGTQTSE